MLATARPRNGGIDALRAAVTILVVLHHTSITYGAAGGWFYREVAVSSTPTGLLLIFFTALNQAWFMGLFFLLAGYFTPGSIDRSGVGGFVRDRLIRLGMPLLVFVTLLGPATIALARTAWGNAFLTTILAVWRNGIIEVGPLWFVEALLIFAALYLMVVWIFHPRAVVVAFPSNMALLTAAVLTGAAAFLLRLKWPVGVNVAALQLGYFASYVVLYVAGCIGARGRWLETIPAAQARLWRRIAWFTIPVLPVVALAAPHVSWLQGRPEGGWDVQALIYAFWEPFVAWGMIIALLQRFQSHFAVPSALWQRLSRRAYLVFIIHPPIVVGVALIWRTVAAPALVKFAVSGTVAIVLCFVVAGALLRVPAIRRVV